MRKDNHIYAKNLIITSCSCKKGKVHGVLFILSADAKPIVLRNQSVKSVGIVFDDFEDEFKALLCEMVRGIHNETEMK